MAIDLEKTLINELIHYPEYLCQVSEIIDFTYLNGENSAIYNIMLQLKNKNIAIDAISLFVHGFKDAHYLSTLPDVWTDVNIIYHTYLIYESKVRRELLSLSKVIHTSSIDVTNDVFDEIDKYEKKLKSLNVNNIAENEHISESVKEVNQVIINVQNGVVNENYVQTGFFTYDNVYHGFFNKTLIVLAARPSHGKTALALNLVRNISQQKPCLFFSCEMPRNELATRLISAESGINSFRVKLGNIFPNEFEKYILAKEFVESLPIYIDDRTRKIDKIINKSRRYKREKGIGFIVIDYLQLLNGNNMNREREIGEMSAELKSLAKELDLPILLLSQLNRAVEARLDKVPILADLRDSGSIEQDADDVIFLMRPEIYGLLQMPESKSLIVKNNSYLKIAKSRGNTLSNFELEYIKELTKFKDWELQF